MKQEQDAVALSIIRYLPELPREGSIVEAEGEGWGKKKYSDRCTYENGKFMGGGIFPIPLYELKGVTRWFYSDEYDAFFIARGDKGWGVSFEKAEKILRRTNYED